MEPRISLINEPENEKLYLGFGDQPETKLGSEAATAQRGANVLSNIERVGSFSQPHGSS